MRRFPRHFTRYGGARLVTFLGANDTIPAPDGSGWPSRTFTRGEDDGGGCFRDSDRVGDDSLRRGGHTGHGALGRHIFVWGNFPPWHGGRSSVVGSCRTVPSSDRRSTLSLAARTMKNSPAPARTNGRKTSSVLLP